MLKVAISPCDRFRMSKILSTLELHLKARQCRRARADHRKISNMQQERSGVIKLSEKSCYAV